MDRAYPKVGAIHSTVAMVEKALVAADVINGPTPQTPRDCLGDLPQRQFIVCSDINNVQKFRLDLTPARFDGTRFSGQFKSST